MPGEPWAVNLVVMEYCPSILHLHSAWGFPPVKQPRRCLERKKNKKEKRLTRDIWLKLEQFPA